MTRSNSTTQPPRAAAARMGVDFPLAAFEQRIAADPVVLGMLYAGSLGRGTADRYSDLDITLCIRDDLIDTPRLLEHYMSWLGELHFVMSFGRHGNGYAGPDWQSIDVELIARHEFEPSPYLHGATVIKDTDGFLAAIVAASPLPTPALTRDSAQKVIEEAIHILGHITMLNLRGSTVDALANFHEQITNLYGVLARLRGREPYDVRFAEQFLAPEELALLYAAWPAGAEREAIRRAVRGLWAWTRYVWTEAEQTFGDLLDRPLDVNALLDALERPYTWEAA